MNILIISLDNDILKENSASQRRHFEYGKICDSLDIIVLHAGQHIQSDAEFENVRIYGVAGKNKIARFFEAYRKAQRIVEEKNINLVTTQDVAFTGLIGYFLKNKYGIKLNVQIHGAEEKLLNKILFWPFKGIIIKNADSIRVVSERLKAWVMKKYKADESKIFKIPVQIDQENKKTREQENNETMRGNINFPFDFMLLTVGRLVKVKNINLQLEALAEIIKTYPKAGLVIVGEGPERNKLEYKVRKLGLKNNVVFEGWKDDLGDYYEQADIFLLTSNHEGWGRVVVEAMSAGCPVIMTDVGCAGEIIKNDENGIIIPVRNKEKLVIAILEMIANHGKREAMSKRAKESGLELDRRKYLELYRDMWESEFITS